jgi:hypothetical protein
MTHADLPGGWRTNTLQLAVFGLLPIDKALHLVGVRDNGPAAKKAEQDLTDARSAYEAGDQPSALATAESLAEEIRKARQPGRGAAA